MSALTEPTGDDATLSPDTAPLSFGQRRLWFLERMEPGSPLYNIPYLVRLRGPLQADPLRRALDALIRRHTSLRTTLVESHEEPLQRISPAWTLELPTIDLSWAGPLDREIQLRRLAGEEARRPFQLGSDLMLRATLLRLGPADHGLLVVMHHAAADGWSIGIFYRELSVVYAALVRGQTPELPELPIEYGDYAAWQHEYYQGPTLQRLLDYWEKRLAGAPPLLELPTDHPRPPLQSYRGAVEVRVLPAELLAGLQAFSREQRVTLFMTLLAGFKALLHRLSGSEDIVVGSPLAGRDRPETDGLIGFFVNFLVLRTDLTGDPSFRDLIGRVRETTLSAYDHQDMPFEKLVEELQPARNLNYSPVCQIAFALQNAPTAQLQLPGLEAAAEPVYTGTAKFDLTFSASEEKNGLEVTAEYATDLFDRATVRRLLERYQTLLAGALADPAAPLSRLPLLAEEERHLLLETWNRTETAYADDQSVDRLFAAQAARTPQAPAIVCQGRTLSYAELNRRADLLAERLRRAGVGPEVIVGLWTERTPAMMVGLWGILKAGGAYLPLDPSYPAERLAFMLEDSRALVVVAQGEWPEAFQQPSRRLIRLDQEGLAEGADPAAAGADPPPAAAPAERLAYLLYTSGSTGKPKGVQVTHRNLLNFFAGMDRVLGREPGVWLAVTSISFDISGLELFWTLTRGFKVVVLSEEARRDPQGGPAVSAAARAPDFSLFYFGEDAGSGEGLRYRLMLEGARFADENGFEAVWTPERHFHAFGGQYPNPAVTGAAIAAATKRVKIRAGSVVLPLHHPLRVAEEWSMVDNLSGGRVGISFASGWHDRDFVLAPGNFANRKQVMREGIETVRRLWRGDPIKATDGAGGQSEVRVFPPPVQSELPCWITAAGNPDTFRLAGEMGANVLTHLLGQSAEELARKIAIYREARAGIGGGPGRVTLALHTFLGADREIVRALVKEPLCAYLLKSLDLVRGLTGELYPGAGVKDLADDEKRALIEHAFNRYFDSSGLLGTPEGARDLAVRLAEAGVDEIACLIDFGVPTEAVIESFSSLKRLRDSLRKRAVAAGRSLADELAGQNVTHLQCTPSFARLLLQVPKAREQLRGLRQLLVGGEALPAALAAELQEASDGTLLNMYGPTETTIWSATAEVEPGLPSGATAPLGRPIANTRIYILDRHLQLAPIGVAGELYIGGDGVARGYLRRPELTAERFLRDPFRPSGRLYRTGDLARLRPDGVLEFLGRADQQVKLRGHRIELGEIEAVLGGHPAVRAAAVVVRPDAKGEPRLAAYVVAAPGPASEAQEWREYLRRRLPEPMVPSDFVVLERMPLTPNGKIDRRALPAPGGAPVRREAAFIAPQSGLEQTIAEIWGDVLGVRSPGADDNFFDLGGHSLLVVRVQSRLRESLGVSLSVLQLFQYPTIRTLTRAIAESKEGEGASLQKIRERVRRQRVPAAAPQSPPP